jgi:L-fuconolactonase
MIKIDAHQHYWNYNSEDYGWMSSEMGVLKKDYLPEGLAAVQKPIGFEGAVAVQARQDIAESEFLMDLVFRYPNVKGVVGWVDLRSPAVDEDLENYSKHPTFVGVRHVIHDEEDDYFMMRPEFQRGISLLANYDLTYDLLLFEKHLSTAIQLVKQFPEQKFVLDHISKPRIKEQAYEPWESDLKELAQLENVFCKLSGMVTEADWDNWTPDDIVPYIYLTLEAFGANRCMIGSDWPVCLVAGEYDKVMGVVTDAIANLSPGDQEAVLGKTCIDFYNLPGFD